MEQSNDVFDCAQTLAVVFLVELLGEVIAIMPTVTVTIAQRIIKTI